MKKVQHSKSVSSMSMVNGQSQFLKAYQTKVKWQPLPKLPGTLGQSQKDFRNKAIEETINKMKKFQMEQNQTKDNQKHLYNIENTIDQMIVQSVENQTQTQANQIREIEMMLKDTLKKNRKKAAPLLSVSQTPVNLSEDENDTLDIEQNLLSMQKRQSMALLKEQRLRTTKADKLMSLLKPIDDIKRDLKNKKILSPFNDINQRSKLANEILIKDYRKTGLYNMRSTNRDISFFCETMANPSKQASILLDKELSRKQSQNQLSTIFNFPQNIQTLKDMTIKKKRFQNHSLDIEVKKSKILKRNQVQMVSPDFYFSPSRVELDGTSVRSKENQFTLKQYEGQQKLQREIDKINNKQINMAQTDLYKQREQDIVLSLEKLHLSSRLDTVALSEWLNKMRVEIDSQKDVTDHQRFELFQFMYNITFIELGKQVSVQCIERGTLLNQIWSAFLALVTQQLKLVRGEKNVLERETITSLERFHRYYEDQLETTKSSMLKMYKESQNYKRSYERLLKDFELLKEKTTILTTKFQELTTLYKAKCYRVDLLEKQNNNLKSIIESLNENSEDEDKEMKDKYFLEGQKDPIDDKLPSHIQLSNKYSTSIVSDGRNQIEEQMKLLDNIGTEIEGFLEVADNKREKELNALEDAEQFAQEMLGEFFVNQEIQMDDFKEYRLQEGHDIEVECQVDQFLIQQFEKETYINEEIFFAETGINLKGQEYQEYMEQLQECRAKIEELESLVKGLNVDVMIKDSQLEFQLGKLQELQKQLKQERDTVHEKTSVVDHLQVQNAQFKAQHIRLTNKLFNTQKQMDELKKLNEELQQENVRQTRLLDLKQSTSMQGLSVDLENLGELSNESSSEEDEEEKDMTGSNRGQKNLALKKKRTIKFNSYKDKKKINIQEFQLGVKQEKKKKVHPSTTALRKFLKKGKSKGVMPKNQLLKQITQTYNDLVAQNKEKKSIPSIIPFVYDSIMNKYGIQKIGKDKFNQLLGTTQNYAQQNPRIRLFGRFLKIVQPQFEQNQIKTYVETLQHLQSLNVGVRIDNQETDDSHQMPYVKGLECIKNYFEDKMPSDEWIDLKKRLEQLKQQDPKGHSKQGILDIDEFIDLVIDQYERLDRLASEKIRELFQASDLQGRNMLEADEFAICYRNVVNSSLGKEYGYLLFEDYMVKEFNEEKKCDQYVLRFDQFMKIALEMDIMKIRDQYQFLSVQNLDKQFENMLLNLPQRQKYWKERLQFAGMLDQDWSQNIEQMSEQIQNETLNKRVSLLRYTLLEKETQELVIDHYLEEFLIDDLTSFIKIGIEDQYCQAYNERPLLPENELEETVNLSARQHKPKKSENELSAFYQSDMSKAKTPLTIKNKSTRGNIMDHKAD